MSWIGSQGHTITTLDKQHDAINKIDELLSNDLKVYAHVSYADADNKKSQVRYFREAKRYLALMSFKWLRSLIC